MKSNQLKSLLLPVLLALDNVLQAQKTIYFTYPQKAELTVNKQWQLIESDFNANEYDAPAVYFFKDSTNAELYIYSLTTEISRDSAQKSLNTYHLLDSVIYNKDDIIVSSYYDTLSKSKREIYVCFMPFNIYIVLTNTYKGDNCTYLDRIRALKLSLR